MWQLGSLFLLAAVGSISSPSSAVELTSHSSKQNSDQPIEVLAIIEDINQGAPETDSSKPPPENKISPSKKARDGQPPTPPSSQGSSPAAKMRAEMAKKMGDMRSDHATQIADWRQKHAETLNLWRQKHKQFLTEIPMRKQNLVEMAVTSQVPERLLTKSISKAQFQVQIIPSAFDVPIRNQGNRGTCAAFAGTRAIEILLAQNGPVEDLSEQYFYYASRPDCQSTPCAMKGAPVEAGLEFSSGQGKLNIPDEDACPYVSKPVENNDTQIPLAVGCLNRGRVRVMDYERLESLDDAVSATQQGMPVVAALNLSDNFFATKGFVSAADSGPVDTRKDHAKGHAITFVGYLELPKSLHSREGKYCMLTANSWGVGWGQGGYACLSEEWIKKHRLSGPFLAVKKLEK